MSFMFHPYPYVDPAAVNPVELPEDFENQLSEGVIATAARLMGLIEKGARKIGVDGYPGAPIETLVNCMVQKAWGRSLKFVNAAALLKAPEEISALLKPYLPEDRESDPVLLYGIRRASRRGPRECTEGRNGSKPNPCGCIRSRRAL